MDNILKFFIGEATEDNEQQVPQVSPVAGDDQQAIAEAVLAGASTGQIAQNTSVQQVAAQTDTTPAATQTPAQPISAAVPQTEETQQVQQADNPTTSAVENFLDKVERKIQMKLYFSQAVVQEFEGPTNAFASAFSPQSEVPVQANMQKQASVGAPATQDALADKLAALRSQLHDEAKPVPPETPAPSSIPTPSQPGLVK